MEHLHDADKAGSAVPENGEGFEAGRDESLKTQQIARLNCSTEALAAQADRANRRYCPARFDGFSTTMREAPAGIGIVGVHADQVMARVEGGEFAVTCVPTTAKAGDGGLGPIATRELDRLSGVTKRLHPLLVTACTCQQSTGVCCLACRRWERHHDAVSKRRKTWGRV